MGARYGGCVCDGGGGGLYREGKGGEVSVFVTMVEVNRCVLALAAFNNHHNARLSRGPGPRTVLRDQNLH